VLGSAAEIGELGPALGDGIELPERARIAIAVRAATEDDATAMGSIAWSAWFTLSEKGASCARRNESGASST
jgi:hypothetical protein